MKWTVRVNKKVEKGSKRLPVTIRKIFLRLLMEIQFYVPYRSNWQNKIMVLWEKTAIIAT